MEILIIVILAVLAGIYVGWKSHEHFMITVIKVSPEIMEAACKAAREELDIDQGDEEVTIEMDDGHTITTTGTELAIEQVKGVLYAYSKSDHKFIAQGNTIEELLNSAHARFPGKTFFGNLPE
jgi:hypothetical protein